MKHTNLLHLISFLLLFLALTSESISVLPTTNQESICREDVKPSAGTSMVEEDTQSHIDELMGLELGSCEDRDEECLQRRLISEAHLDYIYTQQNKD